MATQTPGAPLDPLAQLRDIHLPDTVSSLPIAPGWWLLAILLIVGIGACLAWLYRYWSKRRYRRQGLAELTGLLEAYSQNQDDKQYLVNLSALLKRIAMTRYPRDQVAALSGVAWLEFLDQSTGNHEFTMGAGQVLAYGTYRQNVSFNLEQLHGLVRRWIRQHK